MEEANSEDIPEVEDLLEEEELDDLSEITEDPLASEKEDQPSKLISKARCINGRREG